MEISSILNREDDQDNNTTGSSNQRISNKPDTLKCSKLSASLSSSESENNSIYELSTKGYNAENVSKTRSISSTDDQMSCSSTTSPSSSKVLNTDSSLDSFEKFSRKYTSMTPTFLPPITSKIVKSFPLFRGKSDSNYSLKSIPFPTHTTGLEPQNLSIRNMPNKYSYTTDEVPRYKMYPVRQTVSSSYTQTKASVGAGSYNGAIKNEQIKQHSCSTCGKRFARKSDRVRHEYIHSGHRPNQCNICGKQFIQRSALTVHIRVHTGEKPHKCESCHKAFSDSSSLARHRRTHTGTRPFVCQFPGCNKDFTRKTTLTRHISRHTEQSVTSDIKYGLVSSKTPIPPSFPLPPPPPPPPFLLHSNYSKQEVSYNQPKETIDYSSTLFSGLKQEKYSTDGALQTHSLPIQMSLLPTKLPV